ncbi:MAG: helix-turn-helix domain-containing protein [Candidatus Nanopelagicales bacterium]|nr:helix-turn-helix domain-containing protein [Candidatus Nanopelagicales bacterium]
MDTGGWWAFIDAERQARGWTLAEFARRTKINQSNLTRWDLDSQQPSIENLRRIAAATGISMLTLLVESGHITQDESEGKAPEPPEVEPLDVVEAIKADGDLLPEAKQHLIEQYRLLLRVDSQPSAQHSPGLRAVARKTGRRGNGKG